MTGLLQKPPLNAPDFAPPRGSGPELGRAFILAWHERSSLTERTLRESIVDLVKHLKDDRLPTEEAVVAFKTAIRLYGGVHSLPTLVAEEHGVDGEECALTYERAFAWFIEIYFAAP
jgi:hypothetical protein